MIEYAILIQNQNSILIIDLFFVFIIAVYFYY